MTTMKNDLKTMRHGKKGEIILCRSYTSGAGNSARVIAVGNNHFVQSLHKPGLNFCQNVRRKHK
jgi:hypothetical protein